MTTDIKARLGLNVYKLDPETHIRITQPEMCGQICPAFVCTRICPAHVYTLGEDGLVHVEHDGCLECGTCVVACPGEVLEWHYPRQGQGIVYRFG